MNKLLLPLILIFLSMPVLSGNLGKYSPNSTSTSRNFHQDCDFGRPENCQKTQYEKGVKDGQRALLKHLLKSIKSLKQLSLDDQKDIIIDLESKRNRATSFNERAYYNVLINSLAK